ncbi:hypothetical protein ACGFNU_16880 [Spirillospora sp. NPDC048911]|uniref:hypothetical protein n=1 Tax=Spirillospora sp. NPDC048911 TaxID=3364527 RepID=UPI003718500D
MTSTSRRRRGSRCTASITRRRSSLTSASDSADHIGGSWCAPKRRATTRRRMTDRQAFTTDARA